MDHRKRKSGKMQEPERAIFRQIAYFPILRPREVRSELRVQSFPKRGVYRLHGFWISTRFPFGFFSCGERIEAKGEVLVYPLVQEISSRFHLLPFLPGHLPCGRILPYGPLTALLEAGRDFIYGPAMPELPEVETIARGLAPRLIGRTIAAVEPLWEGSLGDGPPGLPRAELLRRVPGGRVAAVRRRAKVLLMDLAPADGPPLITPPVTSLVLAFHFKMSGGLVVTGPGEDPPGYARILFPLDDGSTLCFRDMRKFGWCRAFESGTLGQWPFWAALGPEPLELADADFAALFTGRRARIKALLLDQSVIAGIGNIYADEALHRAGIRPDAPADRVSRKRLERLGREVRAVLAEGIAANGSSIRDYRDAGGNAGAFQNDFRAYGRGGQPCRCCGKAMHTCRVAGRTSTFCPGCQR